MNLSQQGKKVDTLIVSIKDETPSTAPIHDVIPRAWVFKSVRVLPSSGG
ncbi:MAG: hypothetical protein V3V96_08845 [Acidiferrobacterales bacterium]